MSTMEERLALDMRRNGLIADLMFLEESKTRLALAGIDIEARRQKLRDEIARIEADPVFKDRPVYP